MRSYKTKRSGRNTMILGRLEASLTRTAVMMVDMGIKKITHSGTRRITAASLIEITKDRPRIPVATCLVSIALIRPAKAVMVTSGQSARPTDYQAFFYSCLASLALVSPSRSSLVISQIRTVQDRLAPYRPDIKVMG